MTQVEPPVLHALATRQDFGIGLYLISRLGVFRG
jgi:hypothetical protein